MKNGKIRIEREVFHLDFARYKDKSLIGKFMTQEFMDNYKYPIHSYIFHPFYGVRFIKVTFYVTIQTFELTIIILFYMYRSTFVEIKQTFFNGKKVTIKYSLSGLKFHLQGKHLRIHC
jgi:hypothetical protein